MQVDYVVPFGIYYSPNKKKLFVLLQLFGIPSFCMSMSMERSDYVSRLESDGPGTWFRLT